jgi:SAM-dependent methyltransferase
MDSAFGKPRILRENFASSDSPASAEVGGRCPGCGGTETRVLFSATDRLYATTDRVFQVVECLQCRLIRLHPQPEPDELGVYNPPENWPAPGTALADQLEQGFRRLAMRDHLHFVERALNGSEAPGVVLDVGCGDGLFLEMLAERGRTNLAGLDSSPDAAAAARRRAEVPVVCATLPQAPFGPGSCAAVTMFQVLQYLHQPACYLNAARELLAPDGRLIVQVPNVACWQFLLLGEHWNGIDVPRHLLGFRLADLEAMLEKCGFEVLRRKHFSLRDNPAGMACSLAPRLDPMARRLRRVPETPGARLWKDAIFLALAVACLPFTLLEAACRAGSTVTVEARKKS